MKFAIFFTFIILSCLAVFAMANEDADYDPISADCFCPRMYIPVCGSDGRTYHNQCDLECAQTRGVAITVVREGTCAEQQSTVHFKRIYLNKNKMKFAIFFTFIILSCLAVFAMANEDADYDPIPVDCLCPRNFDPVCASDSQTYTNPCEFECARSSMARMGRIIKLLHSGNC
ncbi:serine protease inhibitor dipetalogastin-like [Teleopsis dalmanni]|uniref:serine protease inhibitor dipetalogastin-like n=1 Tax=Teleopsis dalmanni TaxID=139649 RepID=UPI0018CEB3ED|nr:serine protease inhibitor dipetalogastin-like [Teleopsis dalmanni]